MKKFRFLHKKTTVQSDDWRNAPDWYKAPVLAGEENDYGDYDYLIEDIPDNTHEWVHYECRCDECGKYRRHAIRDVAYFHTMDGYDYMDYTVCWRCVAKQKIYAAMKKFRKSVKKVDRKSKM